MVEHAVQVEAALHGHAPAVGVPGAPGAHDLAQLLARVAAAVDVHHEDVAPGGSALLAEQALNPVAAQAHQHAVGGGDEAASVAVDEPDVAVIAPAVAALPVDDPLDFGGRIRRLREVVGDPGLLARLRVAGARVEDVGHQRRLARIAAGAAARDEEEGLAVGVVDLLHFLEDVETDGHDAVPTGDLGGDVGRHAAMRGFFQPLPGGASSAI